MDIKTEIKPKVAKLNCDISTSSNILNGDISKPNGSSKVDDVRVDNVSVVTNKIANIDSSNFGKVDDVKVNNVSVVSNKVADVSVPTKTSDIQNDSGFVNKDINNLTNYRTSSAQDVIDETKANTSELTSHTSNTNNPHSVTKAQVGLGNVDNTSDLDKPISTATQSALDLKQNNLTAGTNITIVNDVISSTALDNSFRGSWSNWANVPSNSSQYPADKHGSTTPVDGDFLIVNDASDLPGTTYSITMKITSAFNFSLTYYQGSDIVEVETNPIASGAITYKLNNKVYYTYRYSNSIYFYANTDLVYNGVTYHANEVMFSHWAGTTGTKNWTFSEPANPYSGTWRLSYSGIWSSLGKGGWTPQYQVEKILPVASPTQLGITKLYTSTGSAIDGTIDQNTITAQLGTKSSVSVSDTGTSADVVNYITIDGVEKKLPTGSGGSSATLLWTNPELTYSTGTVSLDLSSYQHIIIGFYAWNNNGDLGGYGENTIKVGESSTLSYVSYSTDYTSSSHMFENNCYRKVSVTTSGVTFSNGQMIYGGSVFQNWEIRCVPMWIWGISR